MLGLMPTTPAGYYSFLCRASSCTRWVSEDEPNAVGILVAAPRRGGGYIFGYERAKTSPAARSVSPHVSHHRGRVLFKPLNL